MSHLTNPKVLPGQSNYIWDNNSLQSHRAQIPNRQYHSDEDLNELSKQEWFQTGVDFVLSLERPCLSHTSGAYPSGNAMSMQGAMLHLAPPTFDSYSRWQVSVEVFWKLSKMADRLDLDGYITPVQAWNGIRDHGKLSWLPRERLKAPENTTRPNIMCQ
ncbi:hypothetical protein N7491_000964, partial [Penicillium cf. griseofulvum]